jgi:hypothetical protein
MKTSESIKAISNALIKFHESVGKVNKESTNPFFKSKYASLPQILEVINKPLLDARLVLVQFPEGNYGLTTRLIHESGEWLESTYEMQPVKHSPQDAGQVITYQRRYAIGAILSLTIDEDDDGNKGSKGEKEEPKFMTAEDLVKRIENAKALLELDSIAKKYRPDYDAMTGEDQSRVKLAKDRRSTAIKEELKKQAKESK